MKVLFDHPDPFLLAHGGVQRQIEATKAALEKRGVQVDFLRWWDDQQDSDLIHFFGKAPPSYLQQAKVVGRPVVMTSLFSVACNRSKAELRLQAAVTQALVKTLGLRIQHLFGWSRYHDCACNVVGLRAEAFVLESVHRVPPERIGIVPLGVANVFFDTATPATRGAHLITTGTINEVKNSVELANAARQAQVPVLFVGKPYSSQSDYWKRFQSLIDGRWVKYEPHVDSPAAMHALLKQARGFVIMSRLENWCLSAHEAAAAGLPLLLPDLPWARERFGSAAHYFPKRGRAIAATLRQFHERAPAAPAPAVHIPTWDETAGRLKEIYEKVLTRRPPGSGRSGRDPQVKAP